MAKGILARKQGMTSIFGEDGELIPVTVLEAGPCTVVQLKTEETDRYSAIQLGFELNKPQRFSKAEKGHFEKKSLPPQRVLREFRDADGEYEVGQVIKADIFTAGDRVKITGISKGKGFQGVMKRHGFGGGRASHGSKFHREPGSLSPSAYPGKVFKGKKLPGRAGGDTITLSKAKVVSVDPENNIILVKGPVPGANDSLLRLEVTV